MCRLFITYRRSESEADAGRLYDRLALEFGAENVFKDVDDIAVGMDFRSAIREAIHASDVLLVVVGRTWPANPSWLHEPGNFVREEIQTAMLAGVAVVPVLVGGASMPTADVLPEEISGFAYKQAASLEHSQWQRDIDRLLTSIQELAKSARSTVTAGRHKGFVVQIQQGLNKLGFSTGLDGLYGPETAAQVEALQAKYGLTIDGAVGPDTWLALGLPVAGPSSLYPTVSVNGLRWLQLADRGGVVVAVQEALNRAGLPVSVDGVFGQATMVQVSAFQTANGLDTDGVVGPDTWQALMST